MEVSSNNAGGIATVPTYSPPKLGIFPVTVSRRKKLLSPIGAVFSSAIFRKSRSRSSEFEDHERLGSFVGSLTCDLQNLKAVCGERILRLEWLNRVASLALKGHNEAAVLIPKVEFPLSEADETWMTEYFDATTVIMTVCNSLTTSISNVEHGHLLAKYAICTLEMRDTSLDEVSMIRARKSLEDWIEVVQYPQTSTLVSSAEGENRNVQLQGMLNGLKLPRERATAKGKGFLNALYGARTTSILACTVLTMAFSGKTDLSIGQIPTDRFEWGSSVSDLIQRCREEARKRIAGGSNRCVEEIENVNAAVKKLLAVMNEKRRFPLSKQEEDEMSASVAELKRHLEVLIVEVEVLREKLDDFLHSVIASRSALLAHLRASASSLF